MVPKSVKTVKRSGSEKQKGMSSDAGRNTEFDPKTGKMDISKHLKVFINDYEARCIVRRMVPYHPIRKAVRDAREDAQAVVKIVFSPQKDRVMVKPFYEGKEIILQLQAVEEKSDSTYTPFFTPDDPAVVPIRLSPLIDAMRGTRYTYVELLYVWGAYMDEQECSLLSSMIRTGNYPLKLLCLFDCLLLAPCVATLANSFNSNKKLSEIYLDFNNFGDEGCKLLSTGICGNKTITLLSLRFCGLKNFSGIYLGKILASTPIQELFLDGNFLEVNGIIPLFAPLVDFVNLIVKQGDPRTEEEKKKKEARKLLGKKKGKLTYKDYPPSGPYIRKISLNDNIINHFGITKDVNSMVAFRMIATLLAKSPDIQEIEIWGNDIGESGAQIFIDHLKERAEAKLQPVRLRLGPKLTNSTLASVMKLAPGPVVKRKGRKVKK